MSKINCIFISHIHGDHTLGLVGLISTFNLLGRKTELHIYAHADFEQILFTNINFFIDELCFNVIFHPLRQKHEIIYEDKSVVVESLPLKHRIPSSGFIFREKQPLPNIRKDLIEKYSVSLADINKIKHGDDLILSNSIVIPNAELTFNRSNPRSYAYCSDTMYSEKIIPYIKGIDLLYHEATFADNETDLAKATGHSTASQAALIAKKANVKQLIVGHFSSRYKDVNQLIDEAKAIFENISGVEDGQIFEIKQKLV